MGSTSIKTKMKLRLLWITPKWPLPADDGSRLATVSLLTSITGQGTEVDLLALTDEAVTDSDRAKRELGVKEVYTLPVIKRADPGLQRLWSFLLGWFRSPSTPFTMLRFNSTALHDEALRIIGGGYSHVVFEGLHPAALFIRCGKFTPPGISCKWIYRAQNCETMIWAGAISSARTWIMRQILRHQKYRVETFERSLLLRAYAVATMTETDAVIFRRLEPTVANRIHVVPLSIPEQPLLPLPPADGIRLLFVGRLDWGPNQEGIEWFLREVWGEVLRLRSDIYLTIAGTGNGEWLRERLPIDRISYLGRVVDTTELYRSHDLALSPVFYGSGVRVKAIEAASLGRAVLGTRLGLVGADLRPSISCLQAETALEWIKILASIDKCTIEQIGLQAYADNKSRSRTVGILEMFTPVLNQSASS